MSETYYKSRIPEGIIQLGQFTAAPDVIVVIQATEIVLLMPIFKLQVDHWADATGDYDLCLSFDGKSYSFINRTPLTETYGYRYISTNWFSSRKGNQSQ